MNREKDFLPDICQEYISSSRNKQDPFHIIEKMKTWHACENYFGIGSSIQKNLNLMIQYNSAEDLNFVLKMLYEELIIKAFKQDEFGTDIGPPRDQIFGLFEDF